jgi:hypothetical protein
VKRVGRIASLVCDIAEEELPELLAWREAVARAEAAAAAARRTRGAPELLRPASVPEPIDASA